MPDSLRVDEELARELIRGQFAPLPRDSVSLLAEGWDYVVYRVDGDWAFRFPRRAVVVPGTELELAVLPRVAELLPLPVPAPVHVGRPEKRFPWPFYGARLLPGAEIGEAALSDRDRGRLARPLARALRTLHAPEVAAALGPLLPADPNGRADMAARVPRTKDALEEVAAAGMWKPPGLVDGILAEALGLPPPDAAAVCHGDLHFRQVLVDGGEPSGIVDWVDVCRSDPGIDLQLVWSLLTPPAREAFLGDYGPVSAASLLRARVLALHLNAVLALYGRAEGLAAVEREAVAGLRRTVRG